MITTEQLFYQTTEKNFEKYALKVFRHQFEHNKVYHEFCSLLNKTPVKVKTLEDIPFLPISFFKSHQILNENQTAEQIFSSSGTTGQTTSKHYVSDVSIYEQSHRLGFSQFYGNIENYVVLALLPSYLEREGSSLIYMVNDFIESSHNPDSGFYLYNYDALLSKLAQLKETGSTILLIGVTYALLDLIEYAATISFPLQELGGSTIIMETGGMKGRRKEMIREELHAILKQGFGVSSIHSEYGMTELLSQAYSFGDGIFECPPWMKVLIRDTEDPLTYLSDGKTGGINVIDLANINSCSFIATQDLGKKYPNDSFEVLGRFDHSDIRGCNLMVM